MSEFDRRPLSELADCRMGETILSKDLDGTGYPIYSADSSAGAWGHKKQISKILKRGSIVIGARGTIGNPRLPDHDEFGCTQTTIAVTPSSDVDPYYLKLALESSDIKSIAAQQAVPMLTIGQIAQMVIAVPPLPEQKKIAEILSGIDKVLTSLQLHADKLRLSRDEVVATFFAEESKTDEFAEIRSFGEIVTGSTPPTSNPLNYGGAMPFISPGDIGDSAVVAETKSTLSAAGAAMSRVIPPSSVCVVCIGSTIGKVALTTTESATNQQINALTPGAYDPFFMLAAISHMKNEIRSAASTHAVPIINKSRFGEISIPKPSIERQKQFGNYISSSHKMLFQIMVEIQKYQYLKKAVSSDLLSGRKRVSV